MVLRQEFVAVALKAEGVVREREPEYRERTVGRGVGQIVDRGDEGERRARDEEAHGAIHRAGIEQRRHGRAGLGPGRGADPLPGAAAGHAGQGEC